MWITAVECVCNHLIFLHLNSKNSWQDSPHFTSKTFFIRPTTLSSVLGQWTERVWSSGEWTTMYFWVRICLKQHVLFEFLNFPEGSFHEQCRREGDEGWLCSQLVFRFYCERLRRRSWGRFYGFARVAHTLVTSYRRFHIFPKAHGADKLSADFLFYGRELKVIMISSCFWHSRKVRSTQFVTGGTLWRKRRMNLDMQCRFSN